MAKVSSKNEISSPWSNPRDTEILFPINAFEKLLDNLGWSQPTDWCNYWEKKGGINLASGKWPKGVRSDWKWGIGLPLLSDIERFINKKDQRTLFGISGLPGCGKSSLGSWIESAAEELNLSISVISLDDFYLPREDMEKAMEGNPWSVPRGLPGSHDIDLLATSLSDWRESGSLHVPTFDKSLRMGKGDRSVWRNLSPKVLILEGWFLGCKPIQEELRPNKIKSRESEGITIREEEYRLKVQKELKKYVSLWNDLDRVWHLKAKEYSSTGTWKTQQEEEMSVNRGSALHGDELRSFIRMINTAIPKQSLEILDSHVTSLINKKREITWVGLGSK